MRIMAIRGVVMFEALRVWKDFHSLERDNTANKLPCECNISLQHFNLEIQKYMILTYNISGNLPSQRNKTVAYIIIKHSNTTGVNNAHWRGEIKIGLKQNFTAI